MWIFKHVKTIHKLNFYVFPYEKKLYATYMSKLYVKYRGHIIVKYMSHICILNVNELGRRHIVMICVTDIYVTYMSVKYMLHICTYMSHICLIHILQYM